jgi:hypothetical protein
MSIRTRAAFIATSALLPFAALTLAACGGKIDDATSQSCPVTENCYDAESLADQGTVDTDVDASFEAGDDVGVDGRPDVGPEVALDGAPDTAICGKGSCTVGTTCSIDACIRATCFADGGWSFANVCVDAAPTCPSTQPSDGTPCPSEGISCGYPMACGTTSATCTLGVWRLKVPACPPGTGCPAAEPANGTPCDPNASTVCGYPSACGTTEPVLCDPSLKAWHSFPNCGGCPLTEPLNGSACSPISSTSTCTWPNACGGKDVAQCASYHWQIDTGGCTPAGCPATVPKLGDACANVGKACYWPCDKALCATTGWVPTNNTCGVCPAAEPADGAACAPGGLSCKWSNACGGTDSGWCNATNWNIALGPCTTPSCPASAPPVGSACTSSLGCRYSNGCGAIDDYVCSVGTWQKKGTTACVGSCPATKPTTGSPCTTGGAAPCNYVTNAAAQCTASCFCSDTATWACSVPSCVYPVAADAGVADIGAAG